jgi:hypothetical protein
MGKSNPIYGLLGLALMLLSAFSILAGLAFVVSISLAQAITGWLPASFVSPIQMFSIGAIIAGIIGLYVSLVIISRHGGRAFRALLGVVAIAVAAVCVMLAIITIETIIGLIIFLIAMVFFLIVADWGLGTNFSQKLLESLPIIGKFLNQIAKVITPK